VSVSSNPNILFALAALAFLNSNLRGSADSPAGADRAGPALVLGSLRAPDGKQVDLTPPSEGLSVLIFYSSECPISNAYSVTYNSMFESFPRAKVNWVGICVDPDLSDDDVKAHVRDFGLKFPVARDRHGVFARKIGATMTPEAFVVDAGGHVRYHGRIDDQFARRGVRNANPSGNDLKEAIAALFRGEDVKAPHVPAVGCPIPEPRAAPAVPTYSKDVVRILQRNCQDCHRRGQVGPFPLDTFDQTRKRAEDIAAVVEDRVMPPWKATRGVGVKFKHDRSLSDSEVATVRAWAEAGAPEGEPADLPAPRSFPKDWVLPGGPDLVLDIDADFEVPATGGDINRCFVVPTTLPKDMYISGIEYHPGNRRVVHHVIAYVDTSGEARKKDAADPGPGYQCFSGPGVEIHGDLGGWAPGNQPSILPDGIGRSLPKSADVIIQVHYHPSGKVERDRTRIGIRFARQPVRQVLHWTGAANLEMKLLAGDSNAEVQAAWKAPVDVIAHAVSPHMHLLGKDMLMSVKFPDGRTQDLIRIDHWDFNWQVTYYLEQPLELPEGSVVKVVAHFDNSASNPRNPNKPPKDVAWGEATTDEMCIGFIALTKKGQDLTRPGEKDDLREIFRAQVDDYRRKRDEAAKKQGRGAKL
jgi:peroxiredoxin